MHRSRLELLLRAAGATASAAPKQRVAGLATSAPPGGPLAAGRRKEGPNNFLLHPALPVDVRLLLGGMTLIGAYALYRESSAPISEVSRLPAGTGPAPAAPVVKPGRKGYSAVSSQPPPATADAPAEPAPAPDAEPSAAGDERPAASSAGGDGEAEEGKPAGTRGDAGDDAARSTSEGGAAAAGGEQGAPETGGEGGGVSSSARGEEGVASGDGAAEPAGGTASEGGVAAEGGEGGSGAASEPGAQVALEGAEAPAGAAAPAGAEEAAAAAAGEPGEEEDAATAERLERPGPEGGDGEAAPEEEKEPEIDPAWAFPELRAIPMYESKPPPPASALVLRTLEEGAKAGDEWSLVYRAILRQAAVDREVFQREIGDRDAVHAREAQKVRDAALKIITDARAEAEAAARRISELERALVAAELDAEGALEHDAALAQARLVHELAREQAALALHGAEALLAERRARAPRLDALRLEVNALSEALRVKAQAVVHADGAHRAACSAIVLDSATAAGRPFHRELRGLALAAAGLAAPSADGEEAAEDALLSAAVGAVPPDAPLPGVPTALQLADEFRRRVASEARQLALLPPVGAGVLSRLVAIAAAAVRVADRESVLPAGAAEGGIEAAVSKALRLLGQGDLLGAAEVMEAAVKGTAAEALVAGWGARVRQRAALDLAMRTIRAHAMTTNATA